MTFKLQYIELMLTERCNLKCKMCNFWRKEANRELNTELIIGFFHQIKKSALTNKVKITFLGGEPFVRKDAIQIIEAAANRGFKCTISTNGTLLNPLLARRVNHANINELNISIDSLQPEIHDYMRGVTGSLSRALKSLEYLQPNNARFKINIFTIISKLNQNDAIKVAEWVKEHKGLHSVVYQIIDPVYFDYDPEMYDHKLFPKNETEVRQLCKTLNQITLLRNRGYPIINPPEQIEYWKQFLTNLVNNKQYQRKEQTSENMTHTFFINTAGDVFINRSLFHPIGNISHDKFETLLNKANREVLIQTEPQDRDNNPNCGYLDRFK